jgi:elongation factor G
MQSDYREAITRRVEVEFAHKKLMGGAGEFAVVRIRLEPLSPGAGIEFSNEIIGGAIPGEFIPSIEKSVRHSADKGGVQGYPVIDFRVTLLDGSYHEVDSNAQTFATAAEGAFLKAMHDADPILLEMIMKLIIEAPEEYVGHIIGDILERNGHFKDMTDGPVPVLEALVPAAKLTGYEEFLRNMTSGNAKCTITEDHWARCPAPDPDPKFPGAMAARIA